MTTEQAIRMLEGEWDLDIGFLGRLRQGEFDTAAFERLQTLLTQLPTNGDVLDTRLVALTWYIPLFMTWQRERCIKNGCDQLGFDHAVNRATNLVETALGVP